MTGIKIYDQFALSCGLAESARLLLGFCLRHSKQNEPSDIELDLRKFNRWVAKKRPLGEFHRKTLSRAIAQLDEKSQGAITILKRYSPWYYKITVRPLEFLAKLERAKKETSPKVNGGNPMFSEAHKERLFKQQQQELSKIDCLFKTMGMEFSYDALLDIWRKAGKEINEVKKAVKLMLFRHSTQKEQIKNPYGWIRRCIQFSWQDNYDPYYQTDLPVFSNTTDLDCFVDNSTLAEVKLCST